MTSSTTCLAEQQSELSSKVKKAFAYCTINSKKQFKFLKVVTISTRVKGLASRTLGCNLVLSKI